MIVDEKESEDKRDNIIFDELDGESNEWQTTYTSKEIHYAMKEYARWYAEKVIERCSLEAEVYFDTDFSQYEVDRQSILKVKDEL